MGLTVLASYSASFFQSGGCNEAALAYLLLLCCLLDLHLFLVSVVRRDRFPNDSGQFAPSKSGSFLHGHDGSTAFKPFKGASHPPVHHLATSLFCDDSANLRELVERLAFCQTFLKGVGRDLRANKTVDRMHGAAAIALALEHRAKGGRQISIRRATRWPEGKDN
jgi:hypothetical protein